MADQFVYHRFLPHSVYFEDQGWRCDWREFVVGPHIVGRWRSYIAVFLYAFVGSRLDYGKDGLRHQWYGRLDGWIRD